MVRVENIPGEGCGLQLVQIARLNAVRSPEGYRKIAAAESWGSLCNRWTTAKGILQRR